MDDDICKKVKALIREQGACVLATASENIPHCSLMAYASNSSCEEIYLMTLSDTRKYKNMSENPAVSILIDTRQAAVESDHKNAMALTVSGQFYRITQGAEREAIRKQLIQKHPELKDFFEDPRGEPVKIILESYTLLEGPTKAYHGDISGGIA